MKFLSEHNLCFNIFVDVLATVLFSLEQLLLQWAVGCGSC